MNDAIPSPIDDLLKEVKDRENDLGFLAELRRGLSPTTREQCWPHIIRFAKSGFDDDIRRTVWCAIGGLAALIIPKGFVTDNEKDNLGSTLQRVAFKSLPNENAPRDEKEKALKNFSPRLQRILDETDTIALCEMVIRVVRMAFNKEVSVNLRNLYLNLCTWNDPEQREKTRLRWTRQYYTVFEPRPGTEPAQEGGNG